MTQARRDPRHGRRTWPQSRRVDTRVDKRSGHLGIRLRALRDADRRARIRRQRDDRHDGRRAASWSPTGRALPAGTPPEMTRLVRRCLEKDRRKRLQAIGDARIELEELGTASKASSQNPRIIVAASECGWRPRPLPTLVAIGLGAASLTAARAAVVQQSLQPLCRSLPDSSSIGAGPPEARAVARRPHRRRSLPRDGE